MNFNEHLSRVQKSSRGPLAVKDFDLDIKSSDASGSFTAYMACFGNVDRANEVIDPGAFKNLDSFSVDGWVGLNHDMQALPVAIVESAKQDSTGLLVTGRWHSTPDAQACRAVVNERLALGKSVKCSIGYKVLDSYKDIVAGRAVRRLSSLEIYECSLVNLPANPNAEVIAAKSEAPVADKILTLDALKSWLDAETKAGRVLSRANHERLKSWHGNLSTMCNQMKAMIDLHDPDRDPGDEPDDDGDEKEVRPERSVSPARTSGASYPAKGLEKLRERIVRSRLSTLTLD